MQEIGQRLRLAREERGVSLEAAESETKIRRKYLEALEDGREVDLPGEVYLKGFLRTYGNYLELDGTALVEEYKHSGKPRRKEAGPTEPEPVSEASPRPEPSSRRQAARAALQSNSAPMPPARPRPPRDLGGSFRSLLTALVVVAVVAGIGYVGWLIALQLGGTVDGQVPAPIVDVPPAPVTPTPEPTPPPKLPDPPPPAKVIMTRGTGQDVIFTAPVKQFNVQMEIAGKAVWMEAEVDGQIRFQGTAATAMSFTGSQMRLRVGHMDDVSLVVNGERFAKPLQSGPYWLIFKGE